MRQLWTILAAALILGLTGCGHGTLQSNDEQIKTSWSEVVNQYQRRADLVPNLVNSVKGSAAQEQKVLLNEIGARGNAMTTTGATIAIVAWFFTGLFSIALVAGIIALLFTLFRGRMGGLWMMDGLGGMGGGGFGGGGFAGGGGSFGGGGASGRW